MESEGKLRAWAEAEAAAAQRDLDDARRDLAAAEAALRRGTQRQQAAREQARPGTVDRRHARASALALALASS